MPAVCSALGTKFETEYGIRLLDRSGPPQGSNVFFRFLVNANNSRKMRPPRIGWVQRAVASVCGSLAFGITITSMRLTTQIF